MGNRRFRNRTEAGQRLADAVADLDLDDPVVLGLPRGGVPVARQVAERLDAPLDVVVVRKIGAPSNPEYALGAIGEGDVEVLDRESMRRLGVDRDALRGTIDDERAELRRRLERYRGQRRGVDVSGRTVVVVDDGIATGRTAKAAAEVLRARGAERVVLAVPVGPPQNVDPLRERFDDVVILETPQGFMAVGAWYDDFGQTSDEEVVEHLNSYGRRLGDGVGGDA
ncbi:MAG: phosphoribosyltransferase family protein [Nitriliruptorales bacterium]|nr:phosphoribosyltransferase family protein [Nitriliruptorales bacterium]